MSNKDNTQHQKYKVLLLIEDNRAKNNKTLKHRSFFAPNNPYQLIETILLTKFKNKKN